jgi:hypothetical protein
MSDLGARGSSPATSRPPNAFRQAVARLPAAPEAFRRLAQVNEQQGRPLDARDALLQCVALVGDRGPLAAVATDIAALSVRVGEPLLAVRWLDRALDEASRRLASLRCWPMPREGRPHPGTRSRGRGLQLAPGDPALLALRRRVVSVPARP